MSLAFVFPGQGAQTIGMGRDLAEAYPQSRAVFETVDEALGEKLSQIIWEGDIDTLTLTRNAQPALMATSMAAMAALEAEGVDVTAAAYVAGHSLGEYSALCAAGALDLADTARLLRVRGDAMQAAVPPALSISVAVAFSFSRRLAASTTSAPAAARVFANCLPRPLPAPVTRARCPFRSNRSLMSLPIWLCGFGSALPAEQVIAAERPRVYPIPRRAPWSP